MLFEAIDAGMLFPKAFEVWMAHRSIRTDGVRAEINYLSGDSERDYRNCARALERFFGRLRLKEIGGGHMVEYQRLRSTNPPDSRGELWLLRGQGVHGPFATPEAAAGWAKAHGEGYTLSRTLWPRRAGANAVRKEVWLLLRILRAAGLWTEEESKMVPRVRAEEADIPRALTRSQQHHLFHVASSQLEFRFIYQYSIVALQTTTGPNEFRSIRLMDVLLESRAIQVTKRGAKNKYRVRTIPLVTDEAVWAVRGLLERARDLGSVDPAHHLLPFSVSRTKWDPTQRMSESGLRKPWKHLRNAAGMPWLRIYDLRHTGITRMAETGMPLEVAMSYAGHMTLRMQRHYTSICMASQRMWGEQVWGAGQPAGVEAAARMPVAREGFYAAPAARHA